MAIWTPEGEAGEMVKLICGEHRIGRVGKRAQRLRGTGCGQGRARAPLLTSGLAHTSWDGQSRKWPFLVLNELLQVASGSKWGMTELETGVFCNLDPDAHARAHTHASWL